MAAAKAAESRDNDKSLKLTHVDSLLLPLSGLALQSEDSKGDWKAEFERKPSASKSRLLRQHSWESLNTRPTARKRGAMFVLEEAACRDDTEGEAGGSDADDDYDDEFTDLSGFIVDDDADISFHGSESLSETDSESNRIRRKSPVRRKLVRGTKKGTTDEPGRVLAKELRSLSMENDGCVKNEKPKTGADGLAGAIAGMHLGDEDREPKRTRSEESKVEVVDLTSSPEKLQLASPFDHGGKMQKPRWPRKAANQQEPDHQEENQYPSSDSASATTGRNAILRFSPPSRKPLFKTQRKESTFPLREANRNTLENAERNSHTFTNPPQTPPASPSKLRSPSKLNSPSKKLLLSPSKRANQIPKSPHRQSIDDFWSSDVINEWNDEYSPVKPPLTISPKKKWKIWENESCSGSESPCESPARRMGSPAKAAGSPTKGSEADKKRAATAAAVAAKRRFGDEKVDLARDLLRELDEKVSDGILAQLSQSTGGVEVIWSKNLRSTAGRANWRRTVTKTSTGSSLKGDNARTVAQAGDVRVQHFASIELAEKIIDNEERLVNTLAHEYCHLANFMVSGVRDQPHGASFKRW
jgi:SprT-like family